jgi:hypothetical protein
LKIRGLGGQPGPNETVLMDRQRGRGGKSRKNKLEKDFTAGQAGAQRCCARTRRVAWVGGAGPSETVVTDRERGRGGRGEKNKLEEDLTAGQAGAQRCCAPTRRVARRGAEINGARVRIDGARLVAGLVGAAGDGGD